MRSVLRIILWMVKGVLLLIALAALVMWPVSSNRWLLADLSHVMLDQQPLDWVRYKAGLSQGRLVFGRDRVHAFSPDAILFWRAGKSHRQGDGWKLNWHSWEFDGRFALASGTEPIRWYRLSEASPRETKDWFTCMIRLWLVALVTGIWPLTSITFALRRRIKRRRAAREGLCKHCGYDLRATPAAGGALLAVCPECGKETHADKLSPPSS